MTHPPIDDHAALAEWVALSEALLRGIVHALNNRLTALSAFSELAAMGDEEYEPRLVLPGELERLQQVSALFRLLAIEQDAPEALELEPVLDDALALHAQHSGLRAVRCEVRREGAQLPVRVPRWALLRLLLVLMESGKRHAERRGRELAILHVDGDEHAVRLHVPGAGLSPYAALMAHTCGATVERAGDEWTVRIPSLLELRRRERAERESARS